MDRQAEQSFAEGAERLRTHDAATFHVRPEMWPEIGQTLQELRRMSRSLVNIAEGLTPLAGNSATENLLTHLRHHADAADKIVHDIYRDVATKAFGPGEPK